MRRRRRGAAAGSLVLGLLMLAACGFAPSSSPSTSPASSTPPASRTGPATAQFNLFLGEPPAHTASFGLFVQTNPASIDRPQRVFCGTGGGDTPPCDPSPYPFTIRIEDLSVGVILDYRFERRDTDGSIEVLDQGTAPIDRALVREVTYPAPSPRP